MTLPIPDAPRCPKHADFDPFNMKQWAEDRPNKYSDCPHCNKLHYAYKEIGVYAGERIADRETASAGRSKIKIVPKDFFGFGSVRLTLDIFCSGKEAQKWYVDEETRHIYLHAALSDKALHALLEKRCCTVHLSDGKDFIPLPLSPLVSDIQTSGKGDLTRLCFRIEGGEAAISVDLAKKSTLSQAIQQLDALTKALRDIDERVYKANLDKLAKKP